MLFALADFALALIELLALFAPEVLLALAEDFAFVALEVAHLEPLAEHLELLALEVLALAVLALLAEDFAFVAFELVFALAALELALFTLFAPVVLFALEVFALEVFAFAALELVFAPVVLEEADLAFFAPVVFAQEFLLSAIFRLSLFL